MDDLVTWLRDQLDDDERAARAALTSEADDGDWQTGDGIDECMVSGVSMTIYDEGGHSPEQARHIARHDPARVLAEVDAKRRILDEVVDEATGLDMQVDGEFRVGTRDTAAEPYVGDVLLRLLALPYASRPGYRDEWKP